MSKGKTASKEPVRDIGAQVWGIVFSALGVLILISLISHYVNTSENVLGHVGSALAAGLTGILGTLPALLFPVSVILFGWDRLRGESIRWRPLAYGILYTAQICLLLSIREIPIDRISFPNWLGRLLAYLLQIPFGAQRFGPYFVVSITLLITTLICFRIDIAAVASSIAAWMTSALQAVRTWFAALNSRPQPVKAEKKPSITAPDVLALKQAGERLRKQVQTAPGKAVPIVSTSAATVQGAAEADEPEDERRQRLERELAEFRAKKNQPVTITTAEAVNSEPEETEEPEESDPIPSSEPETGEGDEGYYKIPQMLKPIEKKNIKPYVIPSENTIADPPPYSAFIDRESIERHSQILEKTLMNFGVEGKVVNVSPGPVITRYEIELAPGIKVSRVLSLQDDISMAVGGQRIRIQAPIPGKAAIGIELPNENRQTVFFKHILSSEAFQKTKSKLPIIVGRTISGSPFVADIAKMPHLLIAGQTGAGKSVCINSFICSLLMTKTPEELRFIMVDPKRVELAAYYQGIPHLLAPVVTESKEAIKALRWGEGEMERRYKILAKVGARNIESFNARIASEKVREGILTQEENKQLPFIVIIVDELADLMMTASKDVEASIQRIAQLARAVGIHLIVATQRPSVDIITGPIKANLTSRIAFRTIQSTDSRTILGHVGSEKLLGQGDMLFLRSGAPDIERFHGAFISEEDVETITNTIRSQSFEIEKLETFNDDPEDIGSEEGGTGPAGQRDELFEQAARTIVSIGQGSTSLLQRRMKIGFARAGRLMDELERAGVVGPQEGSKVREVLIGPDELDGFIASL